MSAYLDQGGAIRKVHTYVDLVMKNSSLSLTSILNIGSSTPVGGLHNRKAGSMIVAHARH